MANSGSFQPGHKRSRGRPKGSLNKTTQSIKEAILNAFEQAGGVEYLAQVARDNPSVFCQLLSKVLPTQLTGAEGGPIDMQKRILIELVDGHPGTDPSRLS